jgi:4-amino-4-deoxychorismate lyase
MHETCSEAYGDFLHENIFDRIQLPDTGIHRLNIWYNRMDTEVKTTLYTPVPVNTVALVSCEPDFDYRRKYTNREVLNNLLKSASGADEIIIVKNGMITDTSKANIVFEKNGKFYTPDTFLLNGTMRQYLLGSGKITEASIYAENIFDYEKMYFINALNPLGKTPVFNGRIL